MTLTLRNNTPPAEQLKPPATEAELRWFRKKRWTAIARTTFVTGGMCAVYYVGSLLRDSRHTQNGFFIFAIGLLVFSQAMLVANAIHSVNLVKDIQAKRADMYAEQRKRIFLSVLDEDRSPD